MIIGVTGACGFVGQHLTERLLADGHKVRALAHQKNLENTASENLEILPADVTDPQTLHDSFQECDIVCHLVGLIAETRTQTFDRVVAQGTINIVEACKRSSVRRIIYISAIGTEKNALSRYHRTKYQAEQAIINSGLQYVILRPSVIFGPGDGFISMLERMIRLSPITPVIGSGRYKLQPVFIDDLTAVISRAVSNDIGLGQIIEIGGPEKLEFLEILNIIKRMSGRRRMNLHLPLVFIKLMARLMETVLKPAPLTTDQLLMMEAGNVVTSASTIDLFGVKPVKLEDGLKKYMRK